MTGVRPPAVAGMFYPRDPDELAAMVDALLDAIQPETVAIDELGPPVALVVPHAGYRYSGRTAAAAYARLRPWAGAIRRVVVVGPAHRVALRGLGLPSAGSFATPLGAVPVDRDACNALMARPGAECNDDTHRLEHSVEVQLPFLQRVLGDAWTLVPVVAGTINASSVADALADLWGAPGTLFVISTDLSHYHDAATTRRLDRATAATIVAASWETLDSDDACGAVPVRGALELARRGGQHVRLVELSTSADGGGPTDHVVGYGSFVVR
jgi:AmmeMemoRadiSam system protein B